MLEFLRGVAYLVGSIVAILAFALAVVLLLQRCGLLGHVMRPAPMTPPDAWTSADGESPEGDGHEA